MSYTLISLTLPLCTCLLAQALPPLVICVLSATHSSLHMWMHSCPHFSDTHNHIIHPKCIRKLPHMPLPPPNMYKHSLSPTLISPSYYACPASTHHPHQNVSHVLSHSHILALPLYAHKHIYIHRQQWIQKVEESKV